MRIRWTLKIVMYVCLTTIALQGCGGGGSSSSGSSGSSGSVTYSTANAGSAQTVSMGTTVTLDGSQSSNINGKPLTYNWFFSSKPSASNSILSNSSIAKPSFSADVSGRYIISLIVSDGTTSSSPAAVTIVASGPNAAPIANAGTTQNVVSGSIVTLNGSGSTDANNDSLSYRWSFTSKPTGSISTLSSIASVNPTFKADLAGAYILSLVVNDGNLDSNTAIVTINASDPPPIAALKPQSIACGSDHSLVISNGTVKSLGRNDYGQLGDGSTIGRGTPVTVSSLTNVVAVAGGENHSIALKSNGTVWTWGDNSNGQLGDGTTINRNIPVQVSGISNVAAIAANWMHSVALKSDGTVWMWGRDYGTTPAQMGNLSNVVSIATGAYFVLALKNDGTVWAWGDNGAGQLGDGTYTTRNLPVKVDSLTNVIEITASEDSSYAIKNDGTVWSWGYWEMVGYPVSGGGNQSTPAQITSLSGVKAITSSYHHVLALGTGGAIGSFWSWGQANNYGELGDGTFFVDRRTPVAVIGISNVTAIATGRDHSLAVKNDGTIWGWGRADYGQIGFNTTMTNYPSLSKTPIQILNLP